MKSIMMPVIAGAVAAAALGLAGAANAAPSGPTTAAQTVNNLQAQGFRVIVNKVGTAPLEQCVVSAVRPGQTYSRMDSGAPGAMNADEWMSGVLPATVRMLASGAIVMIRAYLAEPCLACGMSGAEYR